VPPLDEAEAVELFCARARIPSGDDVAELCRRLDNLPLAVELAAARTSVLSPAQILGRLSKSLDLLKGGRGVEPRHQTLRATIEWSCQLLNTAECALFCQLAVFDGGCTLEAAEAVTGCDIDLLQSVVDKSLVQHGGERFWMLETIRGYALELLAASGGEDEIRSRHLRCYVAFVERSERDLVGPRQSEIWSQIDVEFPNVRAAFARSVATRDAEAALRLVGCRRVSQTVQGPLAERVGWVEAALSLPGNDDRALRARALRQLGDLRRVGGDFEGARCVLEEALAIQRQLPDPAETGQTAFVLGRVESAAGRNVRADVVTREAVAAARRTGDRQALGESLAQLGEIAYDAGDAPGAQLVLEEALGLARTSGDVHTVADSLRVLGLVERDAGRGERAQSFFDEALAIQRRLCDWNCVSVSLSLLGDVALRQGNPDRAATLFTECLELQGSRGQWYRAVDSFWGLAMLAAERGQLERAARLAGAEERLRRDAGTPFRLGSPDRYDALRQTLRQRMDEAMFARVWQEGLVMSREDALLYALADHQSAVQEQPETSAVVLPGVFRAEGEYWTVVFETETFRLKDTKGLHYLAHLLQHPGREFHVLDLLTGEEGGEPSRRASTSARGDDLGVGRHVDAGPLLDERAKASYRSRLRELEDDLNEATEWADSGRTARIRAEMDFLADELAGAVGLGGRDRKAGSAAERARVNITRAVHAALGRIREHSTAVADHLDATIHTGTFCSYTPDPRAPVNWRS
jgi:non-specific serine/threonine protein kinase